jgi:hypothetical protein
LVHLLYGEPGFQCSSAFQENWMPAFCCSLYSNDYCDYF